MIKIIKLLSSEEIICQLVESTNEVIKVKNPMAIGPNPETGSLVVFPWSVASVRPSDEEVFEINKQAVVMMHNAPSEVASQYRLQTSKLYVTPNIDEGSLILG